MADAGLRSLRFRQEREETWTRLERMVKRCERRGAASLTLDDMVAMPALYRATLSSLAVARETSLDAALIDYLEALSTRAYFCVYGARTTLFQRIVRFFSEDWPSAVRGMWRETLASALIMFAGVAIAWALVASDSSWYFSFIPEDMAAGRDPAATTASLREGLYKQASLEDGLSVFSAFLFTHNAQISLFAFALGMAFCVPSAMLIGYNGTMLGAMYQVYAAHGLAAEFGGWIFIHGVTELFAVILSGAAGFHIGWSIAFPRGMTRLAAAERAGRQGGVVMLGVVVMLFVAGLLEGFARQMITLDWARWSVAGASAFIWLAYFYLPRRRAHG